MFGETIWFRRYLPFPEVDMETGSYCFYSMPGINTSNPVDFFRILRLAYVTPPSDRLIDVPVIYPFTYETFTPELIKEKETSTERLEKMNETFSKVMAFLRNSGIIIFISASMVIAALSSSFSNSYTGHQFGKLHKSVNFTIS